MTKPANFILNSDYLSIAQTNATTILAAFGGGTLSGGGDYVDNSTDFTVPAEAGAIDRIFIKKDTGDYSLCSTMRLEPVPVTGTDGVAGFVQVYRPAANTIRVRRVLQNYSTGSNNYPAMTFTIKISSFRPPNLF